MASDNCPPSPNAHTVRTLLPGTVHVHSYVSAGEEEGGNLCVCLGEEEEEEVDGG